MSELEKKIAKLKEAQAQATDLQKAQYADIIQTLEKELHASATIKVHTTPEVCEVCQ